MISFPDIIHCEYNSLILKKVSQSDIQYIWEIAPLNKLFLVIGSKASSVNELYHLMGLDWTSWYLMLDNYGYSYGLIRAIPEMDNSISLHGIGWTQPNKSPKTFVFSWYAFHFWLFENHVDYTRTYCDVDNTNAMKFILKSGYVYQNWIPSFTNNKRVAHFLIKKITFFELLSQKHIQFTLKENNFREVIPKYQLEKSITNRAKQKSIEIIELINKSELEQFVKNHKEVSFSYYFRLIPRPLVYIIVYNNISLGNMILTELNKQKTIVLFVSEVIDLPTSLNLVAKLKSLFNLNAFDLILLEEMVSSDSLKNALSINFQYSGNHSFPNAKSWGV